MLKASLHIHIQGDPKDYIEHTGYEIIDRAHELGYEVLAITCHHRVVMWPDLKTYATERGILLIQGAEIEINGAHTLILNAHPEVEFIKTFEQLIAYKKKHPEIFIIAPHPFFPSITSCLKSQLYDYIDIFDGIEKSWFHSRQINFNRKARRLAGICDLPYIATADIHILEQFDFGGHVLIDAPKNTEAILEALRQKKFKNISQPLSSFKMGTTFVKMNLRALRRYLPWTSPHIPFPYARLHQDYQTKSRRRSAQNHPTRVRN
jgi:predicted metal-dependent phosphoesterase TrpH